MSGSVIALAGTAEKGYLDTQVTVSTPGSHSSIPPPHTVMFVVFCNTLSNHLSQGIGILSRLLVEYEDNPIEAHLERGTPVYSIVQRVGEHAKDFPSDLRALMALQQLEAVLTTDNKALLEAHSPHRPLWSLRRGDHSFPGRTWDPHGQRTYTATIFFFRFELRLLIA